jgi:hypothetical protein
VKNLDPTAETLGMADTWTACMHSISKLAQIIDAENE